MVSTIIATNNESGGGVPMHTGRTKTAWLGFLLCLSANTAQAEVIEVEPDGTTVTYPAPSLYSARVSQPAQTPDGPPPAALRIAANRHDIAGALVAAVAWQESRWRQSAVSPKGAHGLMQLMPSTAKSLRVNALDQNSNADGGAAYLRQLLQQFDGDIPRTLAAYNAGPAAVIRYRGVPPYPETQKYVADILDRLADISLTQSSPGATP